MKAKNPKVKGLRVPRFLLFLLGLLHGKLLKTAAIDPATETISSSYISGKQKAFGEYCAQMLRNMENELKAVRGEAAALFTEEADLRRQLGDIPTDTPSGIQGKRQMRRSGNQKRRLEARHNEIIQRLMEIQTKLRSRELMVREEMTATASAIQSVFSSYGHGALLIPFYGTYIPAVTFEEYFSMYQETHLKETIQLNALLKEVYTYEDEAV